MKSRRTSSLLGVQIVSTGSYVPDRVVTNSDLNHLYGFDPEWIEQRTGILERRHAPPEMATSDMACEAARRAIASAEVSPEDIDLVVVGTFTPDYLCPSAACLVQDRLNLDCPAFDVAAACSGFVYALVTAAQYVATGNAKLALVIGADTNSRIVNPKDYRSYPLFGDGAGAVLVARGEPHQGLICYQMGSDGAGAAMLDRPMGGSKAPWSVDGIERDEQYLRMDGRSVFKWAVRMLVDSIERVLDQSGMSVHDVELYLLHQANMRIIESAREQLGIPADRFFNNLQRYGNTSAGSIPLVLDEAVRAGRVKRGDSVLMCGFGAGLTWGTGIYRW